MKKTLKNILLSATLGISLAFNSCFLPFNYEKTMIRDGDYSGIVVFAYKGNKFSEELINENFSELIKSEYIIYNGISYKNESVNLWYKEQAKKYNKEIDIKLTLFPEQIEIPKMSIQEDKTFPIRLDNLSKYLRNTYDINKYDFISIFYLNEEDTFNAYAIPDYSSFIIRIPTEAKKYGEETFKVVSLKNKTFAHEFSHLIGASDKYVPGNDDVNDWDIMREFGGFFNLDEDVLITEPTAKEIGW